VKTYRDGRVAAVAATVDEFTGTRTYKTKHTHGVRENKNDKNKRDKTPKAVAITEWWSIVVVVTDSSSVGRRRRQRRRRRLHKQVMLARRRPKLLCMRGSKQKTAAGKWRTVIGEHR